MRKLLLLLVIPVQSVFGQTEVSLDSCYNWARNNYPNLKHSEFWQEINTLNQENHNTSYLPQVTLQGQITYQSDVTEIVVPVPGVTVPTVTKDRYNAYAELKQNVWDGGISTANKNMEDAILKSNLSQLEVELYKLNEQVSQAFFTSLVVDKQKDVIQAQIEVLKERLKIVESGVRNGYMEKSAALVLQAEILNLDQNVVQLQAAKNSATHILSILTGQTILENNEFTYTETVTNLNSAYNRPELMLISNQQNQLETQMNLLDKTRNPKLFGFGQAGYGKPGLNMLLDEFKGYYLVGIGVSWKAFDWKNTVRKKQVIQLKQQMLQTQSETFTQSLQILLAQQHEQINKLQLMLKNDEQLVVLRTDITKSATSKLENETITASDYIQEVQSETISKLRFEFHKIQLNEAKEKYNLIHGKTISE